MWLDDLIRQGKVVKVENQFKIDIRVNGIHITNHYVDFRVTLPDGRVKYMETKGFPTPEWIIKQRLCEATSDIPYLVNPLEKELLA